MSLTFHCQLSPSGGVRCEIPRPTRKPIPPIRANTFVPTPPRTPPRNRNPFPLSAAENPTRSAQVGHAWILLSVAHVNPGPVPQRRDALWTNNDQFEDGLREQLGWFVGCERYAPTPSLTKTVQLHSFLPGEDTVRTPVFDLALLPRRGTSVGADARKQLEVLVACGDTSLRRIDLMSGECKKRYMMHGMGDPDNEESGLIGTPVTLRATDLLLLPLLLSLASRDELYVPVRTCVACSPSAAHSSYRFVNLSLMCPHRLRQTRTSGRMRK